MRRWNPGFDVSDTNGRLSITRLVFHVQNPSCPLFGCGWIPLPRSVPRAARSRLWSSSALYLRKPYIPLSGLSRLRASHHRTVPLKVPSLCLCACARKHAYMTFHSRFDSNCPVEREQFLRVDCHVLCVCSLCFSYFGLTIYTDYFRYWRVLRVRSLYFRVVG